jgi:hypothetical protein
MESSCVGVAGTSDVVVEQSLTQIPSESGSARKQLIQKGLQELICEEPAPHVKNAFVSTVKGTWGPVRVLLVLRNEHHVRCPDMEDESLQVLLRVWFFVGVCQLPWLWAHMHSLGSYGAIQCEFHVPLALEATSKGR